MDNSTHCPNCSNLKMYVDQQAELISQLMKMVAATNKRLNVLESSLNIASESSVDYPNVIPNPSSYREN